MLTITDLYCGAGGSTAGAVMINNVVARVASNHWDRELLTALSGARWGLRKVVWKMGVPERMRKQVFEGQVELPRTGAVVVQADPAAVPYVVVDADGGEVQACTSFLRDLALADSSPLTVKSYAHDLLRWWRLLSLVDVTWDRAGRDEVELLVGWLRTARNPQRTRKTPDAAPSGSVNLRTGKPSLDTGYAASTINHALSVLSAFYEFHLQFGRGPLVNPVPIASERRRLLGHRSPIEPQAQHRRAPLRQKQPRRSPRSIPDRLWDELFASMGNHRDRALLAFYVSSGARASELLGMLGEHVDWAGKRIWVVSKGSRALTAVPGSGQVQGRGVRRRRVILRGSWVRRSVPLGWPPVLSVCR